MCTNGTKWTHLVHLVPFVHPQSYKPSRVDLVPNYHLAGDPLELPQVPLGVPGPHFENQCSTELCSIVIYYRSVEGAVE